MVYEYSEIVMLSFERMWNFLVISAVNKKLNFITLPLTIIYCQASQFRTES